MFVISRYTLDQNWLESLDKEIFVCFVLTPDSIHVCFAGFHWYFERYQVEHNVGFVSLGVYFRLLPVESETGEVKTPPRVFNYTFDFLSFAWWNT